MQYTLNIEGETLDTAVMERTGVMTTYNTKDLKVAIGTLEKEIKDLNDKRTPIIDKLDADLLKLRDMATAEIDTLNSFEEAQKNITLSYAALAKERFETNKAYDVEIKANQDLLDKANSDWEIIKVKFAEEITKLEENARGTITEGTEGIPETPTGDTVVSTN